MKALLRIVLTLLMVLAGLGVGILMAPRVVRNAECGMRNRASENPIVQPDWGGGKLSFPAGSAAGIADSLRNAECGMRNATYAGRAGGVAIRQKAGDDFALRLTSPSLGQPGRSGLFELPSSKHFKKQLLPERGDAAAPAADIPLYPQSSCRMQVGQGTACFVGFYLTPDSVEAVRLFYVRVLGRLGWQRVTAGGGDTLRARVSDTETYAKPDEDRTVVVQLKQQDSVTTRIGLVAMTAGRTN